MLFIRVRKGEMQHKTLEFECEVSKFHKFRGFINNFFTDFSFLIFDMAKFYWTPKKSYKKYGKYWKKGYKKSVYKTSKAGTKRVTIVIPVTSDYQLTFPANSKEAGPVSLAPARNNNDSSTMAVSPMYSAYANLYDEARIVGVRHKWYFGGGFTSSATGYFTFMTSVDRCVMPEDLSTGMTVAEIEGSSSVQRTTFTVQQRLGAYRSYWASNLLEKNTWWDTTMGGSSGRDIPALSESTTAFKPCCFFAAIASQASSSQQSLPYRIESEWIVQFRNPKLNIPNQNGRSTFADMASEKIEEVKEIDEEVKSGAKKFDELSDAEKAKIMELVGSMGE